MEILGVKISNFELKNINSLLLEKKRYFLTTLNPEIILKAQRDEEYFYILNQADINIVDGYGLKLAALLLNKKIKRTAGADLTLHILNLAEGLNKKVLIINRLNGLSKKEEIELSLRNNWPKLDFKVVDKNREEEFLDQEIKADILFVNFGAPYQEKFIYKNLNKIPNLKLGLGVGGSFDFITKKIKRAPLFLRKIGLEWLWRLIKQPKRIGRIFRATIVFSYKVISWRYILPYFYRQNVVCFIYRQKNDKLEVLLVERRDEKGHWQLPQGGLDGESIKKAGLREAEEELNISNLEIKGIFKNLYRYNFPSNLINYGYKGQKQNLLILKYCGEGSELRINYFDHQAFDFVDINNLLTKVSPIRKKATEIYLNKFKQIIYEKK